MSALTIITPAAQGEIRYPETDGQPMAETDIHRDERLALIHALMEWYRNDAQVYVAGNLLLYYKEGNPRASVAPDGFVVLGVAKQQRRIYKLWEEGRAPSVVFELTSESTQDDDLERKRLLYEKLGVGEYFLFDPTQDYLNPKLQGFRLQGRYYSPLAPQSRPDGEWQLISQTLSLELHTAGTRLRMFDPRAGEYLRSPREEAEARREAEAELARARAELARLRGEAP